MHVNIKPLILLSKLPYSVNTLIFRRGNNLIINVMQDRRPEIPMCAIHTIKCQKKKEKKKEET